MTQARPTILYIDDDPGIARLVQKSLSASGYDVDLAESGDAGFASIRSKNYDVVALDHHMPGVTGLVVLQRIRQLPNPPPVVYVTGSEDSHIAVAALKQGAVDYVWKDVQGHFRELLVEAIGSALKQERLRREKELADQEIRAARDRAELLLKEVNHRVANSLAIVAGLVGLQKAAIQDVAAQQFLEQMRARIIAIAAIHRRLYTSDDVRIVEVKGYLENLIADLKAAMTGEGNHLIHLRCVPFSLPTDKAISLGIIVTELITNAYKYAYPDRAQGDIRIDVTEANGNVCLSVEDDGVGMAGISASGTGLGAKVISSMTGNLAGTINFPPMPRGFRAELRFHV